MLVMFVMFVTSTSLFVSPRKFGSIKLFSSKNLNKQSRNHALFLSGNEFERNTPPSTETDEEDDNAKNGRQRGTVSETMKERLRREMQSQGADPNFSNGPILGNPILLVSAVIAFLVIVGGKGYFY